MQKNNKSLVVILSLIAILIGIAMLQQDGFSIKDLVNDIIAGFIVFGFFLLIIFLIKKFAPTNPNMQQGGVQAQMEEIDRDFIIEPQKSDVTFKDVAGINEVKEELVEIVDFLKNPEKYKKFGIKMPKGVLLVGPPGVGKTLIARAVAGEAGVPFFYQSGAGFVQMFVGVGAKRVKQLFAKAKQNAPAIIFIDEIDAIGKARGALRNDEREATLNQLLTEMDGFEKSEGVIVIAATNKVDLLDDALLRAGRFDRRVYVELPGLEDREEILKIYLKNKPFKGNIRDIAKMSVGFSGAALASLVNEASIYALNHGKNEITIEDFLAVKDKVLAGKRKILTYTEDEKKVLSYYQAAKAVTAHWLEVDFEKMSLVKDDFKEVDRELVSKSEIESKIQVYLSGIVCVEDIFKEKYSNASKDIKKAKELAHKMITEYGMGDKIVSNEMEVSALLEESYQRAKVLYVSQKDVILKVQEKLLENEIITKAEVKEIFNEVL
ncbi:MAG: ATP-dependent metallopeptidase FtsH/Yme1/Tma family protein [Nautilia sp.]|nr:MAG: ATP-dependent metallopeptidase FtsH/Yme1/Tma family protein [Nautilia sp.]